MLTRDKGTLTCTRKGCEAEQKSVRQPRSYIVRVYRQGARSLNGVVEDARTGEQRPFTSMQELWVLLRGSSFESTQTPASDKPA